MSNIFCKLQVRLQQQDVTATHHRLLKNAARQNREGLTRAITSQNVQLATSANHVGVTVLMLNVWLYKAGRPEEKRKNAQDVIIKALIIS